MVAFEAYERRTMPRLLAYWDERRGRRNFPSLADLESDAIADLWPHCFVVDPIIGNRSLCYIGTAYLYVPGGSSQALLDQVLSPVSEVLRAKEPVLSAGEITYYGGRQLLLRSILLPLSEDDWAINLVLGASAFRIVTT